MLHRENKIRKYHTTCAAELLQNVMDYYGITQADLAKRLGVSQKNISDILNRKRYINEIVAVRIEKVMGISSHLLLTLDSNYKLKEAIKTINQEAKNQSKSKSDLFLKKYSWATA